MARLCIIFAVFALMGTRALAQVADSRQPAIWHEGRQLGYVPGHRRAAEDAKARQQAAAVPVPTQDEIAPVGYYEQESFSQDFIAAEPAWDMGPNCGYPMPCCAPNVWVRAELLSWWLNDMNLPALVTTSPTATPANQAGVLGQPGTQVLFGDGDLDQSPHLGGRFTFGKWLDQCECVGFEGSYFFLGSNGTDFSADGLTTPILARPVFSAQTFTQAAMLVAYPNLLTGNIDVSTSSQMQGFEALMRVQWCRNPCSSMSLVAGYRYLNLDESLRIDQVSRFTVAQGNVLAGTSLRLFDQFSTENQFHGAQIGVAYTTNRCFWTLDGQVKFAVGGTRSVVAITGQTMTTVPNGGGTATFNGGLLAQQSNIGRYTHDDFAFVPELTLTARRDLGCNMQLLVGYNLMIWTSVARPGDQIDTAVSAFPPEPAGGRPRFAFDRSTAVLQGLQLGLEMKF